VKRALLTILVLTLTLTGGASALGAGALDGNPGAIDFGTVAVGETPTRTETLTNPQSSLLPVTIISVDVTGSGFSRNGGSCSPLDVLAPGDSCTVGVQYSPGTPGSDSGSLDVVDDIGTNTFALQGTGVVPIVVQPGSLAFGNQRVNTTGAAQPVAVTNNRSTSISLNISKSGPNPADFIIQGASSCDTSPGGTLGAGASCNVLVAFSPSAEGGRNATLNVAGQTVDMSGQGIAPGIMLSTNSIAFGNQPVFTSSGVQTVTVTNTGSDTLRVDPPAITSGATLQFTISDTCVGSSPLAPGAQCTISVQFTPTVTGSLNATLTVPSELPPRFVALSGTGRPSAVVFSPSPFVFQRARKAGTASSPKTITLVNRTNGPLSISQVKLAGVNPRSFRIDSGTCQGKTLLANATCTETVRFAPNDVGARSALLQVTDNGPNSPHALALSGRAVYPANDRAVRGAVGCSSVRITWLKPTGSRYAGTIIVRNHAHVPSNLGDGTIVPHGDGVMNDTGLAHFTTYFYRVFARYHSQVQPGTFNHSRGTILREHTGQICTPKQNGVLHDATPTATWLPHASLFGYAFRLFHAERQVQQKVRIHTTHFTFDGARRLHRGYTYTLFLYAYPASDPDGVLIGQVTFRVA
jgi:hypothetical protein